MPQGYRGADSVIQEGGEKSEKVASEAKEPQNDEQVVYAALLREPTGTIRRSKAQVVSSDSQPEEGTVFQIY